MFSTTSSGCSAPLEAELCQHLINSIAILMIKSLMIIFKNLRQHHVDHVTGERRPPHLSAATVGCDRSCFGLLMNTLHLAPQWAALQRAHALPCTMHNVDNGPKSSAQGIGVNGNWVCRWKLAGLHSLLDTLFSLASEKPKNVFKIITMLESLHRMVSLVKISLVAIRSSWWRKWQKIWCKRDKRKQNSQRRRHC